MSGASGNSPEIDRTIVIGFWTWLFKVDEDGDRGLYNVVNWWLLFHLSVASALGYFATSSPLDIARGTVLPGAAILVGLAFGWAGRSASLLQDKDFSKFLIENGPRPEGYVYSFQLAILMVLLFVAVGLIIVAGGVPITLGSAARDAFANRLVLFASGSLAVRESWGVIYFVNKLTIQYYRLREHEIRTGDLCDMR